MRGHDRWVWGCALVLAAVAGLAMSASSVTRAADGSRAGSTAVIGSDASAVDGSVQLVKKGKGKGKKVKRAPGRSRKSKRATRRARRDDDGPKPTTQSTTQPAKHKHKHHKKHKKHKKN